MKNVRIILAIVLSLTATNASAKWYLKGAYTHMAFKTRGDYGVPPALSMTGFGIGLAHDFSLRVKGLSIRPGLGYTSTKQRTTDLEFYGFGLANNLWKEQTVRFTIDVKYALEVTKGLDIYAFAGPGLGFGASFTQEVKFMRHNEKGEQVPTTATHNMYTGVTQSNWPGLAADGLFTIGMANLGIIARGGVGIRYKWIFAEVDYTMDLINRNSDVMSRNKIRTNVLSAGIGVVF